MKISDKIYVRDLSLRCIIGIFPEERKNRQDVVVNLVLEGCFSEAAKTDNIEYTANYKTITKRIIQLVEESAFFLIETLAEQIAGVCLDDPRVHRATVTLDKPGALRFARSVAVEVTREKTT
ncbi:MAG TPA: dihydroneopterin aldolase [Kiritimatiellia bacterium]|nr:dihydroneopterin aldolase [Kiritimatiellia bacterium]HMO98227.1 dihydroneopterin aldolase [Kiritimatiellia bacterium]HMP97196.1 dihydroneopterin aldolase [Kiritimatiellia bacterium]